MVLSDANAVDRLLQMTGRFTPGSSRVSAPVRVAYLGTATYDLPGPQQQQTCLLLQRGCDVRPICVADPDVTTIPEATAAFLQSEADIILVSGGNTLYAVRRWEETGLDAVLRAAAARQAILAGGSAGAICWFTSGHSDSADPTTFMRPMMMDAIGSAKPPTAEDEVAAKEWSYIRVHSLNILPGMLCPHYDQTQSNGVRRGEDFKKMLRRHPTEYGVGIDHWAVLMLLGDGTYEVYAVPGKTRTLGQGEEDAAASPAVFTVEVSREHIEVQRVPTKGDVTSVLRTPCGPVVVDPFERYHAMENPTPSSGPLVRR